MNSEFEQIETEIIVLGAFYAAAIITLVVWLARAVGY